METAFEQVICLPDMDAWEAFASENADWLEDEFGSLDVALDHMLNGGLSIGGGAAPLTRIYFEI
jgi:hypothetical protein